MSRHLLTIKYDGTSYCGWQVQPNGVSVQSTVQKALIKLTGEDNITVTGCSRTDSGVHADMFCLHFDSNTSISDEKLPFALNMNLPDDIVAFDCKTVSDDFHARYMSTGKTYIYKIYNSPVPDPFKYKYSLRVNRSLDAELMNSAARHFIGTHDFKGFCSVGSSVKDTVRTVYCCSVSRNGDDITVTVTADGFLYNMVRIIVGTLLEVSAGSIKADDLPDIINSGERKKAGPTAKAHGLYLKKVYYEPLDFTVTEV